MKYTQIPEDFKKEYHLKFIGRSNDEISNQSKQDPVIFAHYYLGKKLRLHQSFMMFLLLKAIDSDNRRLVMCLARQLGKSIGLGIFIFWACWYNKIPATISKITSCYIISRDDEASVELLEKIRMIIFDADKHMGSFAIGTAAHTDKFFTKHIIEPNNTHQLTIDNHCFIKSIPPTGKMLGKSASIGVIDEAHRLKCDNPDGFYNQFFRPTLAETGGLEILSSSPEGIVGFFYELIDPDDKRDLGHDRLWFDHKVWDDDSIECKRYQAFVLSEKQRLEAEAKVQQELEAKQKADKEAKSKADPKAQAAAEKLAAEETAVLADRQRRTAIEKLAKEHKLPQKWAEGLWERGVSLTKAEELVELADLMQPIKVGEDQDKATYQIRT